MEALKAELAKKREQIANRDRKLANGKGYVKRKDVEEYESAAYLARCNKKVKPAAVEEVKEVVKPVEREEQAPSLDEPEVLRRLRERGEPIKTFGESALDTYRRLRQLEMIEPHGTKSHQNDFKSAMDKIDKEYLNAMMSELHGDATAKERKVLPSFQEMKETCREIGSPDTPRDTMHVLVMTYWKWLFDVWEQTSEEKFEANNRDMSSKLERAKIKQAESYLRPLYKALKRQNLDEAILRSLGEIADSVIKQNYIRANDAYLQTAIGNAAWPIGVTMVGIHARTGREKLFAHNVAHVLNDEVSRKYLQAVKRLMTFAQRHFPTDPSRSVEYQA